MAPSVPLAEIIAALGGELHGDPALRIERLASLDSAGPAAISFIASPRYAARLAATQAACVIVAPGLREAATARGAAIVADDPHLYFARLTQWWLARQRPPMVPGVHRSAVIGEGVHIHPGASIGALAVIEDGARIGEHAVIGPHCVVGAGASVGAGTRLAASVTLAHACRIGQRGLVQSGAVIGADGFGFAAHAGQWVKIEQLGAVVIGDDVEIGANTCIDRGALDDTVIGDGAKLDNLIQIGHNVRIGAHTAMAGCTGVAGSTRIGHHCTIGGAAIILGHLQIADHVHISVATVISRSIHKPGHYSGFFPFDDNATWEKNAATLRQLYSLRERLRALEKKP
jgi:UDP-3-O-[3-hydroxymyristoyl] glucosamine N-acyltransferase